ncbi:UPF0146 family protein [Saliphagus sp. LR7]|uniref:UPF0146 family protein n=1 Tax=Saliphagus sp. LR7 TaxID=2282654 RepID=UPI001E3BBC63|nr:UPF0146 family protein [Saliphagus sp. LR7]
MSRGENEAIVDRLARERVVEVGIGRRTDVANALAERGTAVVATDVHPREVPEAVEFVIDDVVSPTRSVYEGADLLYALNLPPELHRPARDVARAVGAEFRFTTLGGDGPAIPADQRSVGGETLYAPAERGGP